MNDVEEIKQRVDVVDLIGSYLPLKKAGSTHKGLCPFHSEKTPSFMVNPERQSFKCFGCNEGGDIFEFVMKIENLTFPEALHLLADKAGVTLTRQKGTYAPQKYAQQKDEKSTLYRINAFATQIFHTVLLKHADAKPARVYLKKRGFTDASITTFRIGYAPTKPLLAPLLAKHGMTVRDLDSAGQPDRFKDRIIFPITDVLGNVAGFTGRSLDPLVQPKYYNTPETTIFHKGALIYGLYQAKSAIKERDCAVCVEGQVDVVLAHQCGVNNTVASSGTALTPTHLKTIGRYTKNCIFAFDMDAAGDKATRAATHLALDAEINALVATLPKPYKDAGEAIAADPTIFISAIDSAIPALEWVIQGEKARVSQLSKTDGPLTPVQKKTIVQGVLPYLAKIIDSIERDEWVKILAGQVHTQETSIVLALKKFTDKQPLHRQSGEATVQTHHHLTPDELLFGFLHRDSALRAQQSALYNRLQQEYTGNISDLATAVDAYLSTVGHDNVKAEIDDLIAHKQSEGHEAIKLSFAQRIAQAERDGNRDIVKKLLAELQSQITDHS